MAYPEPTYNSGVDTGLSNFKNPAFKAKVLLSFDKRFEPPSNGSFSYEKDNNKIHVGTHVEGYVLGKHREKIKKTGRILSFHKNDKDEIYSITILTDEGEEINIDPDTCKMYSEDSETSENYKNILSYTEFLKESEDLFVPRNLEGREEELIKLDTPVLKSILQEIKETGIWTVRRYSFNGFIFPDWFVLPDNLTIDGNLYLVNTTNFRFPKNCAITGDLDIAKSDISIDDVMDNVKLISGDFYTDIHDYGKWMVKDWAKRGFVLGNVYASQSYTDEEMQEYGM